MTIHDDICINHIFFKQTWYTTYMERIRIEYGGSAGLLWIGGWLFSIGFLQLTFWKSVLALIIWPYYIGAFVSAFVQ